MTFLTALINATLYGTLVAISIPLSDCLFHVFVTNQAAMIASL